METKNKTISYELKEVDSILVETDRDSPFGGKYKVFKEIGHTWKKMTIPYDEDCLEMARDGEKIGDYRNIKVSGGNKE